MPYEPLQQAASLFRQKKSFLITAKSQPNGDAIATCLGLFALFKKAGKEADVVLDPSALAYASLYEFLPGFSEISTSLKRTRETTVEFVLEKGVVKSLSHRTEGGKLFITIEPEGDELVLRKPLLSPNEYAYEAIIVVDSPDLESLGSVYEAQAEFFFTTPIINIGHSADNEHFGELNLVELTASSSAEIAYSLASAWDEKLINQDAATCFLTGLITETKSFQLPSITPRTLAISSELISLGGRRELVIEKLFYNKPINRLQIWGRALSNLRTEPSAGVVWSIITEEDFRETKTTEADLKSAIEDLLAHVRQTRLVILAWSESGRTKTLVYTQERGLDLRKALSDLNPEGGKDLVECVFQSSQAENCVKEIIRLLEGQRPGDDPMPRF